MKTSIFLLCAIVLGLLLDDADSKVQRKFGCIRPKAPIFGNFVFNRKLKSLQINCEEGFILVGTPDTVYCRNRKWESYLFDAPQKILDFQDNCTNPFSSSKLCPKLKEPKNGLVFTSSREVGGKATFRCYEGYIIDGSDERVCYEGNIWSGEQPVCRSMRTIEDMANLIEDKMISKLSSATATSEDSVQTKLAVGKSGLDIIFALDVSSSIGDNSLKIAKDFIKLLVKTFGVSPNKDGGKNGTRVALVTFSSKAKTVFNLDDDNVRSKEAVFKEVEKVKNGGGGTNFNKLMTEIIKIYSLVIDVDEEEMTGRRTNRMKDATRAVFVLTDAEDTSSSGAAAEDRKLRAKIQTIKDYGFEIFTIGVGHTDKFKLSVIASAPYTEHVFIINEFADLERMADIISEKNIDYGQCGISGNTEIPNDSGDAKKGAWPWIGWVNVYDPRSPKTCGGYLVCQRYFVTTATCVTIDEGDGNFTVVDSYRVSVTLGDHKLYRRDTTEFPFRVHEIHIHPQFTGEENKYRVKDYDIALLDFGSEKKNQPVFAKTIKPICMGSDKASNVYTFSDNRLLHLQQNWRNTYKKGFVAGWGHKARKTPALPVGRLTQSKRTAHQNARCKKRYPGLDTSKFFCVGNREESKHCKTSDIGGPYMDLVNEKQYAVLGMALDTTDCEKKLRFSIFLKTLRPDIVDWLGNFLSTCNRMEEIVPTKNPPTTTMDTLDTEDNDDLIVNPNDIEY